MGERGARGVGGEHFARPLSAAREGVAIARAGGYRLCSMIHYAGALRAHYAKRWGATAKECRLDSGPVHELPDGFHVLEFPPRGATAAWVYATCGMSPVEVSGPIELHLLAPAADEAHVELLTVCAHYHVTGARLGLHHTVNFGRPWLPGSACDRGFISLPYPFGPELERFSMGGHVTRCLWLMPVTAEEVEFKKRRGVEALEQRFEERGVNCVDPLRASVC